MRSKISPQQTTTNSVHYYDTSSLERSPLFPQRYVKFGILLVAIAAVIGVVVFLSYNYTVLQAPARAKAAVAEVLAKEISYNIPQLKAYCTLSADEVLADLNAQGIAVFGVSSGDPTNKSTAVFHAPSTLSLEDAQKYYTTDINKLSANQAAQLLFGSWELTIGPAENPNIRLRYADFNSGNIDSAIANALNIQGLGTTTMESAGTDSSGNTYQSGSFSVDENTYSWRISALKLSDVYSIDISDDAVYVGIKIAKVLE